MWAILQYNPGYLTYRWAEDMLKVVHDAVELNQQVDEHIHYMVKHFTPLDAARAVKTWLTYHQLPIEPELITSFDAFHNKCGSFISKNTGNGQITIFEKPQ